MLKEFKEFAMKGNMLDLAIGVVIGTAFGKIVESLVNDIIMPPFGKVTGGIDFASKKLVLQEAVTDATGKVVSPENALNYGKFLNFVITFLIVAFALFLMVKGVNAMRRKDEAQPQPEPAPTADQVLLAEIRDLLKAK